MNAFDKFCAGAMGFLAGYMAYGVIRYYIIGRRDPVKGVGKVERVKRRIYKEISIAQDNGVDLNIKYADMPSAMRDALRNTGEQFGWKQSKRSVESGKTYTEAYYNSLKRAYNAVSGCEGVGAAYNVRNAEGDIVLTWRDAEDHVRQEPDAVEVLEKRNAELRKRTRNRQRKVNLPVVYNMQEEEPANENYAEIPMTKQQEILAKFPYLKTHDIPGTMPEVTDRFNYIVWKKVQNPTTGDTIMEGPVAAFMTEDKAQEFKKQMSDVFRSARSAHEKSQTKYYNMEKATFSVKHISKVNLNAIAGLFDFTF